jgi:hypothetical protein
MIDYFGRQTARLYDEAGGSYLLAITLIFSILSPVSAQRFSNPVDLPLQLSGSFCDLRPNHFHAGIDIRTGGVEGHAVRSVAMGYVSRITVSPWGYGKAVYITHPNDSIITVYSHLQRFNTLLEKKVRERQYALESFEVDMTFEPDEAPMRRGEIIAYSGNTGTSGGPHLHFETRDLNTGDFLDPLAFYCKQLADSRPPLFRRLVIMPFNGKGVVNGQNDYYRVDFKTDTCYAVVADAWGEIALEIRAIDRMDGTNFAHGVKDILVTVDDVETYHSYADRFSPAESQTINSYIDFAERREFIIRLFTEPGNPCRFVSSRNSGIIRIEEERDYKVLIRISDIYGNARALNLILKGKRADFAEPDTVGAHLLRWYDVNRFEAEGITASFPQRSLYSSLRMRYAKEERKDFYSPLHFLHDVPVALQALAQLTLTATRECDRPQCLGIVRVNRDNGRLTWVGGTFTEGRIETAISELGAYAIAIDTVAPQIKPLEEPSKWRTNKKIAVRITDNLSGIANYRGEIDGKYALFEYDAKRALITCTLDEERLPTGVHRIKISVSDRCGNKTEYENSFIN